MSANQPKPDQMVKKVNMCSLFGIRAPRVKCRFVVPAALIPSAGRMARQDQNGAVKERHPWGDLGERARPLGPSGPSGPSGNQQPTIGQP
jgi:hypothetical protein